MAFYGRFDVDGILIELLRNPSPVPVDAVELTKKEIFVYASPVSSYLARVDTDQFSTGPISPGDFAKIYTAQEYLELTSWIVQEFIEQRVAIQLGSTEITSTRIPTAFGLRLLEFRERLRQFLSRRIQPSDVVPTPPDD